MSVRSPFRRTRRGVEVRLDVEERQMLIGLADQLRQVLTDGEDHPHLRRLAPPAYHLAGDDERQAEYERFMADELVASRLAAINTFTAALSADAPLDDGELAALMQAVNAVRLVLGTLLDVGEDDDQDVADDHPLVGEHHLYHYLGYVLECAVRVAADSLET